MGKISATVGNPRTGFIKVLFAALLFVIIVLGAVLVFCGERLFTKAAAPVSPTVEETASREVDIFFGNEGGQHLVARRAEISSSSLEGAVKEALALLIEGPGDGAGRTIPEGTRLLGLTITGDTAYVDLSGEVVTNHAGGSSGEIQTIYSVVDTVTLNFPGIKKVQLLIDGEIHDTLKGHIDIGFPLYPDKEIIKGPEG